MTYLLLVLWICFYTFPSLSQLQCTSRSCSRGSPWPDSPNTTGGILFAKGWRFPSFSHQCCQPGCKAQKHSSLATDWDSSEIEFALWTFLVGKAQREVSSLLAYLSFCFRGPSPNSFSRVTNKIKITGSGPRVYIIHSLSEFQI